MSQTLTATATPTVNKTYAVTNNSPADVLVLDAFASDDNASEEMYEQTLTPQLTDKGSKIVPANGSGNVQLDMNDEDGTYRQIYSLLIAKASNLFPVKSTFASLSSARANPPLSFKPFTIAAADAANMKLAETFYQTISAFPTSDLSKNFQAAVSGATNSSNSDDDIDAAVAKFFSATQQFSTVTLDMVVAVQTYYSQYPFVWTNYGTSKAYYLYTSDGTTCSYLGAVQINISSSTPANTSKTLPDVSVTYTPDSGTAMKLYYVNGQFVDDPKKDIPAVCLSGLFFLKSQLTKKAEDNTIIPILSGTVNSTSVMGYNEKQQQDSDGNWSGLYILLHPKDAAGYLQLFMTFIGVIMGIDFLGKGLTALKDKFLKLKEKYFDSKPPQEEIEKARTEVKTEVKTDADAKYQDMLDKFNANLEATKDLTKSVNDLQKQIQDRLNEDQRSSLNDNLDKQTDKLGEALEYGNNKNLVEIDKQISKNDEDLNNATTEELPDVLPGVKVSVDTVTGNLKIEIGKIQAKVSAEESKALDQSKKELDDAKAETDKIDEARENNESGKTPEDVKNESVEVTD